MRNKREGSVDIGYYEAPDVDADADADLNQLADFPKPSEMTLNLLLGSG